MPELPEVETVRRGLIAHGLHAPIVRVWRSRARLRVGKDWNQSEEGLDALLHARPAGVDRRGKYLIWTMQPPARAQQLALVIHLGMSGRCGVTGHDSPLAPHTHLRLLFSDDRELRFVDARRFGGLRVGLRSELQSTWPPLAKLGPEPLEPGFHGEVLQNAHGASKRCVRDALLDQQGVAGIGNIYAVEACFDAKLHPLRPAHTLASADWQRLARALVTVLQRGISNGGTTLAHFRDVTGDIGRNQDDLRIYGRADQPCPVCATQLVGFMHGGRTGVYCPGCQNS